MQEIKGKIKEEIEVALKHFRYETAENQLISANAICRLLDAYHKTERPYYKKRPYKRNYEYKKKEGGNYEIKCHTEQ